MAENELRGQTFLPKTVAGFFWQSIRPPKILIWYAVMLTVTAIMVFTAMYFSTVVRRIAALAAESGGAIATADLYQLLGEIALMLLTITACNYIHRIGWLHGRVNMEMETKRYLLKNAVRHSHSYFINNHTGRIAQKIHELPWHNIILSDALIREIFPGLAVLTAATIWLYKLHPHLGLIMTVWSVFFLLIVGIFSIRHSKLSHRRAQAKGITMGVLVDSFTNHMAARMFARRDYELHHIGTFIDREQAATQFLITNDRYIEMVRDLPVTILVLSLFYHGVTLYNGAALQLPDLAFLCTIVLVIMQFLQRFTNGVVHMFEEAGGVREGLDLLGKPFDTPVRNGFPDLEIREGGGIDFDNVFFSYNGITNALNGFSLRIEPGQKIGLLGPSGAGKSTVLNLLLRFFDADGQKILIGGQNIYDVSEDSLRRNIAVIPQDTTLFHRTLRENIRYGRLDASDAEVEEAARKAHAHEFIELLPEGYNTLVGERGVKLSGGQRQRIAIARAILKDAPILILDEATSALDSESEHLIQKSLEELIKDKTVIAIAHRLSTIAGLDRLIVMDDGKVAEDGPHKTLLKSGGLYSRLWSMQSGGFIGLEDKEEAA